jgi:hypothetical protein
MSTDSVAVAVNVLVGVRCCGVVVGERGIDHAAVVDVVLG